MHDAIATRYVPAMDTEPRPRRRRRWVQIIGLVVGVLAFALLIRQTGWGGITDGLARTGAWFAVIAAIDLLVLCCDSAALYSFARPYAEVPFIRVFAAEASGVAINRLTPGNALGEPLKISMLNGHVPEAVAVSSVVKFNIATAWVAIGTIILGVPLTLLSIDLPARAQIAVAIASAVLIGVAVLLFLAVRRGAAGLVLGALRKLHILSQARCDALQGRFSVIDREIRDIRARSFIFVMMSRVLYITGTIVLMAAAGIPLEAPIVIASVSVGILINWVASIVPLGVGIADGTNYALYGALGAAGSAGLVFTMVNRLRTALLALMGLTVMAIASMRARS
jgi:hypothetical protein